MRSTSDGLKDTLKKETVSILPGIKAAHFLANVDTLLVANVRVSESHGYGILCVNLQG